MRAGRQGWGRDGREGADIAMILHMLDVHNTWIIQIYSLTKRMFAENDCVWVSIVISCLIHTAFRSRLPISVFLYIMCVFGGGAATA